MAENRRKSENIRRANRVIQTRTFVLMLVLGVAVFLVLALKLYQLQIKQHDYYQSKALDQQTRSTVVTASRGTIYDRNGNELAVSATAETVFLSPKELAEELEKPETKWTKESLSAGLSQLLGVTQESILEQMERTYSQYEVVKLRVDEDTANAVRELLNDNEVHGVYLETDAKRYYPYGSLAAHVIGFVGTDNTGLYGLEAQYEEELQGQTGLVVSAKDNGGNALPYEYEQYYASHNGDDLVLTLDTNVQYYLEKYVKEMADQFEAANGATGIVMDVKTGGVLGMVSYPNYDLNNYSEVSDARLKAAIEDGSASLADQQLRQWRNKALNDTYEPGSTFKILTLSAALEEGVVDMSSTFECSGSITVMGQTIHCSNTSGHGHQTLKEATGNSCNPAFINCGLGLGTDTFYEYMRSFGLLDGSGIDLAGEATGIFMAQSDFSQLDLACYAFGQNFNEEIKAAGDFDAAVVTLKNADGVVATIVNNRKCPAGYDQRLEAQGSTGTLNADNIRTTTVRLSNAEVTDAAEPYLDFFLQRYADAYRIELTAFIDAVVGGTKPTPSIDDAIEALRLAEAATESAKTGKPVSLA